MFLPIQRSFKFMSNVPTEHFRSRRFLDTFVGLSVTKFANFSIETPCSSGKERVPSVGGGDVPNILG